MQSLRFFAILLVLAIGLAAPARAVTLLRDPDIEHALSRLAAPVLRAAGLSPERIDILVIDDASLNAFVLDADTIFLHSGLILRMTNAPMLQSVIAHEAAHIANGHLMRRPVNLRNARTMATLGTLLAGWRAPPRAAASLPRVLRRAFRGRRCAASSRIPAPRKTPPTPAGCGSCTAPVSTFRARCR